VGAGGVRWWSNCSAEAFARFLVDDEIGCGYGKRILRAETNQRRVVVNGANEKPMVWRAIGAREWKSKESMRVVVVDQFEQAVEEEEEDGVAEWIATVVEVDGTMDGGADEGRELRRMPDGQVDMELD